MKININKTCLSMLTILIFIPLIAVARESLLFDPSTRGLLWGGDCRNFYPGDMLGSARSACCQTKNASCTRACSAADTNSFSKCISDCSTSFAMCQSMASDSNNKGKDKLGRRPVSRTPSRNTSIIPKAPKPKGVPEPAPKNAGTLKKSGHQ